MGATAEDGNLELTATRREASDCAGGNLALAISSGAVDIGSPCQVPGDASGATRLAVNELRKDYRRVF